MSDTLNLIDGMISIVKRLIPESSVNIAGNGLIDATEAMRRIRVDVAYIIETPCEDCNDKDMSIESLSDELGQLEGEAFDLNEAISQLKTRIKELEEAADNAKNSDQEVPEKEVRS